MIVVKSEMKTVRTGSYFHIGCDLVLKCHRNRELLRWEVTTGGSPVWEADLHCLLIQVNSEKWRCPANAAVV